MSGCPALCVYKKEVCKTTEVPGKIAEELVVYENKFWGEVIKLGPSTINKIKISQR